MSLKVEWYTGCTTDDERKAREQLVLNSRRLLEVMTKIIEARVNSVERTGLKEEDYSDPELLPRMAFRNGKVSELLSLHALLELTKES